jgi:adenine-specific DNA-methyltransferase
VEDGRIYFGDGNRMPRLKRFLNETGGGMVPNSWWAGDEVGTADSAKRHLKRLLPNLVPFETPKPEPLARRVVEIATDVGDVVLDVYAGSGTTASVAQKLGRQWIVCERERSVFTGILRPRIEAVIHGRDPGGITPDVHWSGGGEYSVLSG